MPRTPPKPGVRLFRFLWSAHKWTGVAIGAVLFVTSVTGFLLIIKKHLDWIQPPTQRGAPGDVADFIPLQQVLAAAFAAGHPDLRDVSDIDRIDFRPAQRVHKVRSKHHHTEIQVDAVTGSVLSVDWRPSDLIEQIHDGSFVGAFVHDYAMPVAALALGFLVLTGYYLWLSPIWRRRRRAKGASVP